MIWNVYDALGHNLGIVNEVTEEAALVEAKKVFGSAWDRVQGQVPRLVRVKPSETAQVLAYRRTLECPTGEARTRIH